MRLIPVIVLLVLNNICFSQTGREWEDPIIFQVNREDPHATFCNMPVKMRAWKTATIDQKFNAMGLQTGSKRKGGVTKVKYMIAPENISYSYLRPKQ